jgi:hypothetical protein
MDIPNCAPGTPNKVAILGQPLNRFYLFETTALTGRPQSRLIHNEGLTEGGATRNLRIIVGKLFHTTERAFRFAECFVVCPESNGRENLTPKR